MNTTKTTGSAPLNRQVGALGMLFTAVAGMVGSGWLFASLYAAQIAGPAAIISWFIGGFVAMTLALVFSELGGMLPVPGALARIPHFSHGSTISYMAGWLCWIAYVTTAPIEVTAVLDYASNYVPWLTISEQGERVLSLHGVYVAAVLMLIFTGINLLGVKWLAHTNTTITFWKLLVPFAAPIILLIVGFRYENFYDAGGFAPNGVAGVFGAVSSGGVMFCLFGFRTAIDMAGEAKNPQRTVPMAMIGAMMLSLVLYILLQIAFIGVIPPDHLKNGWHEISEGVPGGPFAAFATILGLHWLALALYCDAIVSPAGTGLAYTGATARINYAMSRNGQVPRLFERLNRFGVPVWSLVFNFVVGMIVFLPFPGWSALVSFISSTVILSLAFGPVTLVAMRYQVPELMRPFRLPFGVGLSAVSFIFVGFIIYWTGWQTNWKVFLVVTGGLLFFTGNCLYQKIDTKSLSLREATWWWPYIIGMALVSYCGNFGGGLGLLAHGIDLIIIAIFSLAIFALAVKLRLPSSQVRQLIRAEEDHL